jgi:hypothetical protein
MPGDMQRKFVITPKMTGFWGRLLAGTEREITSKRCAEGKAVESPRPQKSSPFSLLTSDHPFV